MSNTTEKHSVPYEKRPIWHSPPWITAIVGLVGTFLTVPQYVGDYLQQQQTIDGARQAQELELVRETLLQKGTERVFLLRYIAATSDDDQARDWAADEVDRFVEAGISLKEQLGIPPLSVDYNFNFRHPFGSSSSSLSAQDKMELDSAIVEDWKGATELHLIVVGHTSNTALSERTTTFNSLYQLSKARADVVADYLAIKLGVDRTMIITEGRADKEPVASNSTQKGRDLNDRIDIIITGQQNK